MKETLLDMIRGAVDRARKAGALPDAQVPDPMIEEPKKEENGDFSTNCAMVWAKTLKMAPRKIAEAVAANLDDPEGLMEKTDIAGPGFLNFYLKPTAWHRTLAAVRAEGPDFGKNPVPTGKKVQVEFVSANPTGPLHVGHGRGAALGDALASLLAWAGNEVSREYYINDSGRQIRTLGLSVYLRLLEGEGRTVDFPEDCYQGDYIRDLAGRILQKEGPSLLEMERDEAVALCARFAAGEILAGIRNDLEEFGVAYDDWFSEQSLYDSGEVDQTLAHFREKGVIYENEGALWFKTSDFGDEKDRVVVRNNGLTTYFASDIAYHRNKFERGLDRVIDIWGADHHGYVNRVTAAVEAMGYDRDRFTAVLVTLVNLLRAGEPVAMSTRAGEFVTLKDVVDEVGRDAARFLFLTRHHESPLDFDLEVAKKKTNDNPVFYVQYVHARISSIRAKALERGLDLDFSARPPEPLLTEPEEVRLLKKLAVFPQTILDAAAVLEPHRVTYYLMDLAALFHAYYNRHRVLVDEENLSRARLALVLSVRRVIQNGLTILGVSAPESM